MRLVPALVSGLAFAAIAPVPRARVSSPERIVANDNRMPAGTLRDGILVIKLEAREGEWHPDAESAPGLVVRAFAEGGKPLSIPGPMVRVPEGTEIRAVITNSLPELLVLHGLSSRGAATNADTLQLAAGASREVRFLAGTPGTYYYWGRAANAAGNERPRSTVDAELSGAFIVDPRGGSARDRVLLIALWSDTVLTLGNIDRSSVLRFSINGKSWPNTERIAYDVGDTVRFRVINTSAAVRPLHLHGFYFDVTSRGDGRVDSIYSITGAPYRVVTERVTAGRTFTMTWVPERAGNWLFHCHDNFHVLRNGPLDGSKLPAEHRQHVTNHALDMMGGLVMGIEVRGRDAPSVALADRPRRALRLIAQPAPGGTDSEPSFGYVLQDGSRTAPTTASLIPGPTIVLERGQPVAITVVNRLPEATAVHWHGIELESYFDGVADFAGSGTHIAKAIAPNDSFVAYFTPPRSGTFMYHPHADEVRQQQAGLSGVLLVVDDPAAFDPTHDISILITVPRSNAIGGAVLVNGNLRGAVLVNGSLAPPPLELRAGERYRLRIVDVHTRRPSMIMRVLRDTSLVTWRAIAKDGMELPPQRATVRPAIQQMGNGETYDFELAPATAGDLRFTVSSALGVLLQTMPIHVR
ncbi:MAG: multicopper oxidase domain-containing protein [Gemmatimonadaceae bacterium]